MSASPLKIWFMAIRPKTLFAASCPVIMGTAMAFGDGIEHLPSAFLALTAALCIQIGTNLANDYFDCLKGADNAGRIGPTRVTQAGLLSPRTVKWAFIVFFMLAALLAVPLIIRGGWPILLIAVLSIISGILYTGGPKPFGYLGLGELFVLIFFGPVAVAGTYYVQSFEINMAVVVAGLAPGLLSVAVLSVNNLRDRLTDAKSGKKTLAVRFGQSFAIGEYYFAVLTASLVPIGVYFITHENIYTLAASGISLLAIPSFVTVVRYPDDPVLNRVLATTGILLFIYTVIFSISWIL